MDLALKYDDLLGGYDLALENGDLEHVDGLEPAVLLSLVTDARAAEDDDLPDAAGGDRRGWWADAYSDIESSHGSRLWLLSRSVLTADVVLRAGSYAREAMDWLVEDGLVASLDVEAQAEGQRLLVTARLQTRGADIVFEIIR